MINDWYQTFAETRDRTREFYCDVTEKEENSISPLNPSQKRGYNYYHGRQLWYIPDPIRENMVGYSKLEPNQRNQVLCFEGRAVDEVAYVHSNFEFEFYWNPVRNIGIICTKSGKFRETILDRVDYEDSLDYISAIECFFHDGQMPHYSVELTHNPNPTPTV